MHYSKGFSLIKLLKSFGYAFKGLAILIREEQNGRVHLLAAGMVVICGMLLKIAPVEWGILMLCMALVLVLEIINSALERIADFVSTEFQPLIGQSKDLCAAAVLVAALFALAIACIILLPKIILYVS